MLVSLSVQLLFFLCVCISTPHTSAKGTWLSLLLPCSNPVRLVALNLSQHISRLSTIPHVLQMLIQLIWQEKKIIVVVGIFCFNHAQLIPKPFLSSWHLEGLQEDWQLIELAEVKSLFLFKNRTTKNKNKIPTTHAFPLENSLQNKKNWPHTQLCLPKSAAKRCAFLKWL